MSGKVRPLPPGGPGANLTIMRPILIALALAPLIAACSLPRLGGEERPDVAVTENPGENITRPEARPQDRPGVAEGLAPGADAEGAVPPPPAPGAGGLLGETLAGLGATGGPGMWVQTGLVSETRQGRVETTGGGRQAVELRPSGAAPSAGSTISIQAMQALGLPLGQLATLRVFAD
ncbi:MAG: hypothetical protein ACK4GT_11815 [Pararhodobacter sp.]